MPVRVPVQPLGGASWQRHPAAQGQRGDLVDGQRPDLEARASAGVQPQAFPAVAVGAGPARHDDEHPVAAQPADGRQQRFARRRVGPMEVLDDDGDRPVVLRRRPPVHELESRRERGGRVEVAQLGDQAERHVRAELVGLGAQDGERGGQRLQCPVEQRRLPRARRALDPHEPGPTGRRVLGAGPERGQRRVATDERRIIRAPHPAPRRRARDQNRTKRVGSTVSCRG